MHTDIEAAETLFQVGGAVREGALYVTRSADRQLPEALKKGAFCFVLAPRQMGKSSLKVRCATTLRKQDIHCVEIDLTDIGSRDVTPEQWYFGLTDEIANQLALEIDVEAFWLKHGSLSPVHRWSRFIRDYLATSSSPRTVIFIDEIDGVLSLPFSIDDFFAAIRACYNHRAEHSGFNQVSFCLLGVAAPTDLMRDPSRTPFNVGEGIPLEDFTKSEATAFLPGLKSLPDDEQAYLNAIMSWTSGHPYMTQRLCNQLLKEPANSTRAAHQVRQVVEEVFINPGPIADSNLETTRNRMARSGERLPEMLRLYQRLLDSTKIELDERDPVQLDLRLAGLLSHYSQGNRSYLKVRNRIFAAVFNLKWVKGQIESRPFAHPLSRWLQSERSDDDVLRGSALGEALAWAHERQDLAPEEAAFLLQGLAVARASELERMNGERAKQERAIEAERMKALQAKAAKQRTFIGLMGVLITVLAAALLGGYFLQKQVKEESRLTLIAVTNANEALEREAALLANRQRLEQDRDQALKQLTISLEKQNQTLKDVKEARKLAEILAVQANAREQEARLALKQIKEAKTQIKEAREEKEKAIEEALTARIEAENSATRLKEAEARAFAAERSIRAQLLSQLPGQSEAAIQAALAPLGVNGQGEAPAEAILGLNKVLSSVSGPSMKGHSSRVSDVIISPNNQHAATASWDGTVRLWDVPSGNAKAVLSKHTAAVISVEFSPDSTLLATCSEDGTAKLWSVEDGALLRSYDGHNNIVRSVRFSPDGQQLLTTSLDGSAQVSSIEEGRLIHSLPNHIGGASYGEFSPDGQWILTYTLGKEIHLWKASTGKKLRSIKLDNKISTAHFLPNSQGIVISDKGGQITQMAVGRRSELKSFQGHTTAITATDISPDGLRYVTADDTGTAKVWSLQNQRQIYSIRAHSGPINGVQYSKDGRQLFTIGQDRSLRIFAANTGDLRRSLTGHSGAISAVDISSNGNWVITGGWDSLTKLWHAYSGTITAVLNKGNGPLTDLDFSPNSATIATGTADGVARLWDARTGRLLHSLTGHNAAIKTLSFSSDGEYLLTAGEDKKITVWGWKTGSIVRSFERHTQAIQQMTLSPLGSLVASFSWGNTIILWDWLTARPKHMLKHSAGQVIDMAFSPTGARLVTIDDSGNALVWNTLSGDLITLTPLASAAENISPTTVAFSTVGLHFAVGTDSGEIITVDAFTGIIINRTQVHDTPVTAISYTPDSDNIVSGSQRGDICLSTPDSGEILSKFLGHSKSIKSLAFTADGHHLLSSSNDKSAILWQVSTSSILAIYDGHYARINAAKFSPSGDYVATVSEDGLGFIHPAQPESLISRACNWLTEADSSDEATRLCQIP